MIVFTSYMVWARGLLHSCYGPIAGLLQEVQTAVKQDSASFYAPILNVGAVGACLVLLGLYYMKKDAGYEKRIDAQLERERDFSKQLIEQNDKYRAALEKTNAAMDTMIGMLKQLVK